MMAWPGTAPTSSGKPVHAWVDASSAGRSSSADEPNGRPHPPLFRRRVHARSGRATSDCTRRRFLETTTIESTAGFELALELTVKATLAGPCACRAPHDWRDPAPSDRATSGSGSGCPTISTGTAWRSAVACAGGGVQRDRPSDRPGSHRVQRRGSVPPSRPPNPGFRSWNSKADRCDAAERHRGYLLAGRNSRDSFTEASQVRSSPTPAETPLSPACPVSVGTVEPGRLKPLTRQLLRPLREAPRCEGTDDWSSDRVAGFALAMMTIWVRGSNLPLAQPNAYLPSSRSSPTPGNPQGWDARGLGLTSSTRPMHPWGRPMNYPPAMDASCSPGRRSRQYRRSPCLRGGVHLGPCSPWLAG